MPIIETEIWKKNPDRPGTVIFDSQRKAQDIFNELEAHLKADGRLPDEYFLFDARSNWKDGALFPRDGEIVCNVNYGDSEGIYLDISVRYSKKVYEYHGESAASGYVDRVVTEHFATGKTLGESIEDLDKMNLVASSVTAAFYGSKQQIQERYARIESGAEPKTYQLSPYNQDALDPPDPSDAIKVKETADSTKACTDSAKETANCAKTAQSSGKVGLMDKLEANKRKIAEQDAMKDYAVETTE